MRDRKTIEGNFESIVQKLKKAGSENLGDAAVLAQGAKVSVDRLILEVLLDIRGSLQDQ